MEHVNIDIQEKLKTLKESIKQKVQTDRSIDDLITKKVQLEEEISRNRFSIDIDYITISDPSIARVIKVGNAFTIYLANSLKDSICKPDGNLNYKVIQKIRELMSHELGHIVLHTKDLLLDDSLQGTANIKAPDQEEEADVFGKELLNLRRERNKRIRQDGGADTLF